MAKKTEKAKKVEVMRSIKIHYTDAECQRMGKQIAYSLQEIGTIKSEAAQAASGFKQRITTSETQVKTLQDSINLGYQMVTKTCILIKNFDTQKREYWFDGQVVDEEPLTKDDYQTELNLAEEENKKEADRVDQLDKDKADPQKNGEIMSIGSDAKAGLEADPLKPLKDAGVKIHEGNTDVKDEKAATAEEPAKETKVKKK